MLMNRECLKLESEYGANYTLIYLKLLQIEKCAGYIYILCTVYFIKHLHN